MDYDDRDRTISPSRPRSRLSSELSGASTAQPVEWSGDDWISREEEFRDTISALQYEQERIQKKTFTNWINSHLDQHPEKWVVNDLFVDLKDGRVLLALIEVITGDRLPAETFRHYTRAHYLSNVERALDYLRDHQIKLVNINSSEIVDGNETVILGLIWSIILNFQIDQDLAHLRENFLLSPLPSGAQSASHDARSRSASPISISTKMPRLSANSRGRFQAGASKAMLKWCQKEISQRYGIPIVNLNTSWKNGMAFLGLVKVLDPNLVNLNEFATVSAAQRMSSAFGLAQERLNVPRLLDVSDIDVDRPDERSIMTYIAQFIKRFPQAKANRQNMLMENLPDVDAIEAVERDEYERIRDWCSDSLTLLKCMEYTDDRPFETYEDYKRFQQLFRCNMSAYARLKEQFEEGRTLHISESNIAEVDTLFAKVMSEKHIWHRHLFEVLQGQERNFCHGLDGVESELDQRVLIPAHRGTSLPLGTLEFRVQKYQEMMSNLERLLADLDSFLRNEEISEAFAWHDLPMEVKALTKDVDRRLLATRCKLLIRRQVGVVDEWEKRVARWQELLRSPADVVRSMERVDYEYELHVVQGRIFDAFLDLSKQLQAGLERLHEDSEWAQHQRAAFLSTAVNSNRRWKRLAEELHRIREEVRRFAVEQRRKSSATAEQADGPNGNGLALPRKPISSSSPTPHLSLSPTSPTMPQPLYFKSEKWSLYLQMLGAFSRWLDRMERDFESIDRENVNRVEYQAGLQRFRALCTEVVEHKSDGQAIIDTFYTCSADLPPAVLAEETRKINRLIRRYDALIPSLEVVRSEVEHSTIHSHQLINRHQDIVELVPDRPESTRREQHLRVVTPARSVHSPSASAAASSGYATPEIETALLRRSQPTTPSDFVNRSPPFADSLISNQSSVNEGSAINEPVYVHDIDMEDSPRSISRSPREAGQTFVRDIQVREAVDEAPSFSSRMSNVQKARAVFSGQPDLSSDDEEEEMVKRRKVDAAAVPGHLGDSISDSTTRHRVVPTDMSSSKISALKSAFENAEDMTSTSRLTTSATTRRSRSSTSSRSSSNSDEERKKRWNDDRKKHRKEPQETTSSTMVGVAVKGGGEEEDSPKKRYLRNVKTTTLVTSTETKTVKTTVSRSPSREALSDKLSLFSASPQPVVAGSSQRTSVGKVQSPFVDSDKKGSRESLLSTSSVEAVSAKSRGTVFTRGRSDSEEGLSSSADVRSPSERPTRTVVDVAVKAEKPSSLGLRKVNTKTEFEETTKVVKRTVLSPVSPSREKVVQTTVVETMPLPLVEKESAVRNISFDEGIKPVIGLSSVKTSSLSPQRVTITPYSSPSKSALEIPDSARKANRMIDLFEKGASNPDLFTEQLPQQAPQRDVVRLEDRPLLHVSYTSPFQLADEATQLRPLNTYEDEDIQLVEPVSQRINRYREIVSSPSTATTTLPSFEPPARRTINPNFNAFVTERFIQETQSPTREETDRLPTFVRGYPTEVTPRQPAESFVRSTEVFSHRGDSDEKDARLAGSFYNIPVRSAEREVTPTRAEETLRERVVETKVTPLDKMVKAPSEVLQVRQQKSKGDKVPHFIALSDKQFESRLLSKTASDSALEIASVAPSIEQVGGKIKMFERMQGIEYAKPADLREVEIMSNRSGDTVFSGSNKAGVLPNLLPFEQEKRSGQKRVTIQETSQRKRLPSNTNKPFFDVQMSPITSTVRPPSTTPTSSQSDDVETHSPRDRPSVHIEHRAGPSDSHIDFMDEFVRELNENRKARKEELLPGEKEWQNREVLEETVMERDEDGGVRQSASPQLQMASSQDNLQLESLSEQVRRVDAGTEVKVSSWLDDTLKSPERHLEMVQGEEMAMSGADGLFERHLETMDSPSTVTHVPQSYMTTSEPFVDSPVVHQQRETSVRYTTPALYRPAGDSLAHDVTEPNGVALSVPRNVQVGKVGSARTREDVDVGHFVGVPDRDISDLDSRYDSLKRRASSESVEERSPRRSRVEKYEDVLVVHHSPAGERVSRTYSPNTQLEGRKEPLRQVRREKYEAVSVQRVSSLELLTETMPSRPTSVQEYLDVQYRVSPSSMARSEEYVLSQKAESSQETLDRFVGGRNMQREPSREGLEETVVRSRSPTIRPSISLEDFLSESGLRDINDEGGMSDRRIESFIATHRSRAEEEGRDVRPVSEAISFVRGEVQPNQRTKRPKTETYKHEQVLIYEAPQRELEVVSSITPTTVRQMEPFSNDRMYVREVEPSEQLSENVTHVDAETGVPSSKRVHVREVESEVHENSFEEVTSVRRVPSPSVEHRSGLSDQQVEEAFLSRPALARDTSETDLAPKRRTSATVVESPAAVAETSVTTAVIDEPQYPWQSAVSASPTMVREEETIRRSDVPSRLVNVAVSSETLVRDEPSISQRRQQPSTSSSSEESTRVSATETPSKERKKSGGFLGLFSGGKKEKLVKTETIKTSSSVTSVTSTMPTHSASSEPHRQTVVRSDDEALDNKQRAEGDTVSQLIYESQFIDEPNDERLHEMVERPLVEIAGRKAAQSVTPSERPTESVTHHVAQPDREAEAYFSTREGADFVPERHLEQAERETITVSHFEPHLETTEPDVMARSPSRQTTQSPSFITFEQSTSTSTTTKVPSKKPLKGKKRSADLPESATSSLSEHVEVFEEHVPRRSAEMIGHPVDLSDRDMEIVISAHRAEPVPFPRQVAEPAREFGEDTLVRRRHRVESPLLQELLLEESSQEETQVPRDRPEEGVTHRVGPRDTVIAGFLLPSLVETYDLLPATEEVVETVVVERTTTAVVPERHLEQLQTETTVMSRFEPHMEASDMDVRVRHIAQGTVDVTDEEEARIRALRSKPQGGGRRPSVDAVASSSSTVADDIPKKDKKSSIFGLFKSSKKESRSESSSVTSTVVRQEEGEAPVQTVTQVRQVVEPASVAENVIKPREYVEEVERVVRERPKEVELGAGLPDTAVSNFVPSEQSAEESVARSQVESKPRVKPRTKSPRQTAETFSEAVMVVKDFDQAQIQQPAETYVRYEEPDDITMVDEEEVVPRSRPAELIQHRVNIKDDYIETMNLPVRSTEQVEEVVVVEKVAEPAESTVVQSVTAKESPKQYERMDESASSSVSSEKERKKSKSGLFSIFKRRSSKDHENAETSSRTVVTSEIAPDQPLAHRDEASPAVAATAYTGEVSAIEVLRERPSDVPHHVSITDLNIEEHYSRQAPVEMFRSHETVTTSQQPTLPVRKTVSFDQPPQLTETLVEVREADLGPDEKVDKDKKSKGLFGIFKHGKETNQRVRQEEVKETVVPERHIEQLESADVALVFERHLESTETPAGVTHLLQQVRQEQVEEEMIALERPVGVARRTTISDAEIEEFLPKKAEHLEETVSSARIKGQRVKAVVIPSVEDADEAMVVRSRQNIVDKEPIVVITGSQTEFRPVETISTETCVRAEKFIDTRESVKQVPVMAHSLMEEDLVPRQRPDILLEHGHHLSDGEFERLSQSVGSARTAQNVPDQEVEYESVVTSKVTDRETDMATVLFGVSERHKLVKDVFDVQQGAMVVSARLVPAIPQDFVTVRRVDATEAPPSTLSPSIGSTSVQVSHAQAVEEEPRPRPDAADHRHGGPSDLLVTHSFVERTPAVEYFDESVTVTTTEKARPVVIRQDSSEDAFYTPHERHLEQVEGEETVVVGTEGGFERHLEAMDTPTTVTHIHEEITVVHQEKPPSEETSTMVKSATMVSDINDVWDDARSTFGSRVQSEVFQAEAKDMMEEEMVPRSRPDEVPHYVGIRDADNEELALLTNVETLQENTVVKEVPEVKPVKAKKGLERLSTSKKPEVVVYDIDDEADQETVIVEERVSEHVQQVNTDRERNELAVEQVEKIKLSASPADARRYRAPEVRQEEQPTEIRTEFAETLTVVEQPKPEKPRVAPVESRQETLVRESQITARSSPASEAATASVSRTGSRSKTPESLTGTHKLKTVKTIKQKVPKGAKGSSKTKEFSYEDVVYWKTAKGVVSPDHAAVSSMETHTDRTSTPANLLPAEKVLTEYRQEAVPIKSPVETVITTNPTETQVKESVKSKSVSRQRKLETEKVGKAVVKKQRSRSSSTSSSESEREEVEEISSVTINKAKLTSPTPEPRDEVQLTLAEMRTSYNEEEERRLEARRRDQPVVVVQEETIVHQLTPARIRDEVKVAEEEPMEFMVHSHLARPYQHGVYPEPETVTKTILTEPARETTIFTEDVVEREIHPTVTYVRSAEEAPRARPADIYHRHGGPSDSLLTDMFTERLPVDDHMDESVTVSTITTTKKAGPVVVRQASSGDEQAIHERHMEQVEGEETAMFSHEGHFERHMEAMDTPTTVTHIHEKVTAVRQDQVRVEDVVINRGGKYSSATYARQAEEETGGRQVAHRDSETGIALLERSTTEQLPTYISFGTVEPESFHSPPADIVSREIEARHRPSITLRHATGPKDDSYERYNKVVQIDTVTRTQDTDISSKPNRRSLEDSPLQERMNESIVTTIIPDVHPRPAPRPVPSTDLVERAETTSRPIVVSTMREAGKLRQSEGRVVEPSRATSPSTNSDVSFDVENEMAHDPRTASPEALATTTYSRTATVEQKPAASMKLAPTRSRSALSGTRSATLGSSAGEHIEEAVEHIRVKFKDDVEPHPQGRPKTPNHHNVLNNLFMGHEEVHMRTSSRQGDHAEQVFDALQGRSASQGGDKTVARSERVAPLAAPRPLHVRETTVINERSVDPEGADSGGEFHIVRTHSERLGISSPTGRDEPSPASRASQASTPAPLGLPYPDSHRLHRAHSPQWETEIDEAGYPLGRQQVKERTISDSFDEPKVDDHNMEEAYQLVRTDSERLGTSTSQHNLFRPDSRATLDSFSQQKMEVTARPAIPPGVFKYEENHAIVRTDSQRLGISPIRGDAQYSETIASTVDTLKTDDETASDVVTLSVEPQPVISTTVGVESLYHFVRSDSERLGISPRLQKTKSSVALDVSEETVTYQAVDTVEMNDEGFPVVRTHSQRLGISRPVSSTEMIEHASEVKSKKKAPAVPSPAKSKSKSKSKKAAPEVPTKSIIERDTVVFTSVESGLHERSVDAEDTPFPIVRTHSQRLGISSKPKTVSKAQLTTTATTLPTTQVQPSTTVVRLYDHDNHEIVRTHSQRLGLSTPRKNQTDLKAVEVEEGKVAPVAASQQITRRVIETHSSPEDQAMVVETFRQAALSSQSPDVDELEYWTSSGRSSSADLKERVVVKGTSSANRLSNISDTTTYAEIASGWSGPVKSQAAPPTKSIVTDPVSLAQGPIYAKVNKKRKGQGQETLEEDVFYWKILNRKKGKSYSAERLRSHSPANNLTLQEMAILAQSVNSLQLGESGKGRKGTTITKSQTKRRTMSSSDMMEGRASSASPFDDSGAFSGREDLQLTSTLERETVRKASPFAKARQLTTAESVVTTLKTRSFSPSSNEPMSGVSSPSNAEHVGENSEQSSDTAAGRGRLLESMESETMVRSIVSLDDEVDRQYRRATREPLPDQHSCLPAYNRLHYSVNAHLVELEELIIDPECQYIDVDNLQSERQRFTALLDGLVRVNKDLDRLDDLYRAMINVEPEVVIWETESRQRELNRLYMDQLSYLKHVLRRVKHLEMLLDQYKRRRLQFKVHLLEELTFFRTHDNMPEEEQKARVDRLLEEVMALRAVTYHILVRCTPTFAVQMEEELYEVLTLLRTELSGSIMQLLQTGRYSVEYDAARQNLILSSEQLTADTPSSPRNLHNPTVWNVLRRALPMQALALILLGFASLIPMTDDEFSCLFSNYFASSFNPALKFTGPPPI